MKFVSTFIILLMASTITTKFLKATNEKIKNPVLYQISTRPYLYQLSKERGKTLKTLADFPDDVLQDLKDKGFDYIWMMGVWQVGDYGIQHDRTKQELVDGYRKILPDWSQEDAIGCPYSITDYVCNAELCPNGESDLKAFRKRVNDLGMKLFLDFVPNHSALDSPWIKEDKSFYIRAPQGTSDPSRYNQDGIAYGNMQYSSAWDDTAQLNYFEKKLRDRMTDRLKRVASLADGIRCDMAYIDTNDYFYTTWEKELKAWGYNKPGTEFWADAIRAVKSEYPDTIFMAEVYGEYFSTLIDQGFDYTYDKELLDRFKSYHLDNIKGWINYMKNWEGHLTRFLENHDDNRAVEVFQGSVTKTDAAAMATYTLPGMRFFFQDQWFGYKNKLDVHLRRSKQEDKSEEAQNFYKKFLPIITDPTFKNGDWTYLGVKGSDSWRLMAWSWSDKSTGEKRLVVVNFSEVKVGGDVVISDVSGSGQVTIKELFSDTEYQRSADEMRSSGLTVVLDPWSSQIFAYK